MLQYAPKQQLLITGGRKGFVCVFDIRQRQLLHTFQAHDSAIKALALDAFEDFFVTGSAEGNMKVTRRPSLAVRAATTHLRTRAAARQVSDLAKLSPRPSVKIIRPLGRDGVKSSCSFLDLLLSVELEAMFLSRGVGES